jgi:hypothetical protein
VSSRRKAAAGVFIAVGLVVAFFVLTQLLIPPALHDRVRKEVLKYVPAQYHSQTVISSSAPSPAAAALFGDVGDIRVKTPELRVTAHSNFFSLIGEASSLSIKAQTLTTQLIKLQNVSLKSSNGKFVFQGFVSAESLHNVVPFEPVRGKVFEGGVLLQTEASPLVLHLAPAEGGRKIIAFAKNSTGTVPPVVTVLQDPGMRAQAITFHPEGEGWIIEIRGVAN